MFSLKVNVGVIFITLFYVTQGLYQSNFLVVSNVLSILTKCMYFIFYLCYFLLLMLLKSLLTSRFPLRPGSRLELDEI